MEALSRQDITGWTAKIGILFGSLIMTKAKLKGDMEKTLEMGNVKVVPNVNSFLWMRKLELPRLVRESDASLMAARKTYNEYIREFEELSSLLPK
jgi:hypothetical protein